MTIKQNMVIGKGETLTINATLEDAEGNPVDLNGHSVHFIVSKQDGALVALHIATITGNTITAKVEDEFTAEMGGKYNQKLVLNMPNGDVRWLMTGRLTVKGEDD